jgi:crossover junction endodeoxyribonuclease RusA
MIVFSVPGIPIPQGSKTRWGSEDNPHTKPWRQAVAEHARRLALDGPILGSVAVSVDFVFPRPKAHYRTGRYADWLRDDAPHWHTNTPDLDKLARAIGDALRGVVLRDDSQIAAWHIEKRYGHEPRADIAIALLVDKTPSATLDLALSLEQTQAELRNAVRLLDERTRELAELRGVTA